MRVGVVRSRAGRVRVVLAAAAVLTTAGCGSGGGAPAAGSAPSTAPATTSPATAAGTTSSAPSGLQNLTVTADVRAQLVAAYVAARGYRSAWISGTEPGSAYYAYEPASGWYLAWAGFVPAAGAPERVLVGLQDDGARTAFRRTVEGSWRTYDICSTPAFLTLTGGRLPGDGHC